MMNRAKVVRRDRKLHISYESTEQIYCASTYPQTTARNSTIIIEGLEDGVRISWRGGRRRKSPALSSHTDIIMINDSDDEEPTNQSDIQYEEEEEELDSDCPYPSIIQYLKIELGCAVTRIAVPSSAEIATGRGVHLLTTHIIIGAACTDGTIRVLTTPLHPPSDSEIKRRIEHCRKQAVTLKSDTTISISDVTIKTRPVNSDAHRTRSRSRSEATIEGELLVASTSARLNIYQLLITPDGLQTAGLQHLQSVALSVPDTRCLFNTSPRSTMILMACRDGVVRLYDPFLPKSSIRRPASQESTSPIAYSSSDYGRWVVNYHTDFQYPKDDPQANPILARRKRILDAKWILNGRCILVLLEDGEWGMWDVTGSAQPTSSHLNDFVLQGFLGSTAPSENTILKGGASQRLAPMTPNTRRTKSAQLFSGPRNATSAVPKGGISVSSANIRSAVQNTEESVVMWYNEDVYKINNLNSFYQRGTNQGAGTGGGLGSLYAPGLTQLHDLNLLSESITSISQLQVPLASDSSLSFGQINPQQRDVLITTNHSIVIIQNLSTSTSRQLFQQPLTAAGRPTINDQAMLDVGMLDLGGMDRMLDNMANSNGIIGTRPRKVGFAG